MNHRPILSLLALFALALPASAAPLAEEPPSKWFLTPPPGPYASWPDEARDPAFKGAVARCVTGEGKRFADFQGPADLKREALMARVAACVIDAMPEDWPGRKSMRDNAKTHFEAAHRIDPKFAVPGGDEPPPNSTIPSH
jgi:hypothetical protein